MAFFPQLRTLFTNALQQSLWIGLLITLAVSSSDAQSPTDGSTPTGMAPGAPAGSYGLSGFDNINFFNGNLNFNLPLLQAGGRGGAQVPIPLHIEQHWQTTRIFSDPGSFYYVADPDWWNITEVVYSAGTLVARSVGEGEGRCWQGGQIAYYTYARTITRLTFTAPDGTEYELRDQLTGGRPADITQCDSTGASRGTVFITADGTSATFIADYAIQDGYVVGEGGVYGVSGNLMLRDGTRYRIEQGRVTWMRDRNGNTLTFEYITGTHPSYDGFSGYLLNRITDSLNRQVTFTYNVSDAQYGIHDQITVNGIGGAPRTIRIAYSKLQNTLRAGYSLQTYKQLFPELDGSSSTQYNPDKVSTVWLPDGRTYRFRYNSHGELARVELPTGGVYEYDFTTGIVNESDGYTWLHSTYRRAVERRVYSDGVNLTSRMTVSRPEYTTCATCTVQTQGYVDVDHRNIGGTLLARQRHYYYSSATNSIDRSTESPVSYSAWRDGREYKTEAFDSNGTTILRRVENTWQQRAAVSWWTGSTDDAPANDPRLTEMKTTLVDINQVTRQTFNYDQYNNQTDVYEYGFGTGAAGSLMRHTHTDYLTAGYDSHTGAHIRSLPTSITVNNASGQQVARTEINYDEGSYPLLWYGTVQGWIDPGQPRGLPTTTRRWLDTTGGYLVTHAQYDQVGNVRKAWDALGRLAEVEYSSSYHYSLPTLTRSPAPDPANQQGTNTPLTASMIYDFSTGLITSTTDANNQTTSFQYNDVLNRLTRVDRPDGGWTRHAYGQNAYGTYVETYTRLDASREVYAAQYADGLGRPSRSFAQDGTQYQTADTQYDGLGRVLRVSNPYYSTGAGSSINPSNIWTTSQYDALGRVTSVTTPDNAVVTSSYSGNTVTVADQVGRSRRSVTDALGRLTQVIEDPNGLVAYSTEHLYDALGNLRRVTQGTQQRHFMYDSLSRLIRARQPEQTTNASLNLTDPVTSNSQWTMSYGYDANGNLTTRTDARNVTTSYQYDQINRLTRTDYSDATPYTTLTYDFATNGRGRFHQDYESSVTGQRNVTGSYDAMGRATQRRTSFYEAGGWTPEYVTSRSYDYAGNVTGQTYPSGRVVSYQTDAAGRVNHFAGNLGDAVQRTYSTGVQYDAQSRRTQEQFGTQVAVYNKALYNVRGQLSEIRVGTTGGDTGWNRGAIINHYSDQSWAGSGTDNNGNLHRQDVYIPNDDGITGYSLTTMVYGYDQLNRLQMAREDRGGVVHWQQTFDYDRWGNRQINQAQTWGTGINNRQFTVDTNTNRLGVPAGQSGTISYDAAGNQTTDSYSGWGSRDFDAENRLTVQRNTASQEIGRYTYDAGGRRARRNTSGIVTWYLHGLDGELIAEYAASQPQSNPLTEYGYRNGELLVTATAGMGEAGLRGEYFNSLDFTNLAATRTDASVDFDWGNDSPGGGVGADNFTVRWTGQVTPQYSQTYTFYTLSDDGVRLWVDNQLIIDNWTDHGATEDSGQITLQAGQSYQIKMEFYERGGGAVAKLLWSSASQAKEVIPASRLSTPTLGSGARWLITDQLGTPRMTVDQTGSLASVRRHDYLPFGEEVAAGVGGRTAAQGYQPDNIRFQFAGTERDGETGLDFMQARYYASVQGRFISVDPIFFQKEMMADPQRFNLYAYVRNNPLRFVDPKGEEIELTGDERQRQRKLDLLRQVVGREAGTYLYERRVEGRDGSVRYTVGIHENGPDGRGSPFGQLNNVASAVGRIINDRFVVQIEFVSEGQRVEFDGVAGRIGRLPRSPGATIVNPDNGQARIFILDPSLDPGMLPESLMSNRQPLPVITSDILAHELGHLYQRWGHSTTSSNYTAVYLENQARRLRDPSLPTRTGERERNDATGPQPLRIQIRPGVRIP